MPNESGNTAPRETAYQHLAVVTFCAFFPRATENTNYTY